MPLLVEVRGQMSLRIQWTIQANPETVTQIEWTQDQNKCPVSDTNAPQKPVNVGAVKSPGVGGTDKQQAAASLERGSERCPD
jgi:hypothetical protein